MFKYVQVNKSKFLVPLLTVFLSFYLIGGCGGGDGNNIGNGGNGPGPGIQTRVVTGNVDTAALLVTAVARDGSIHEVDTHPVTGEFMMELPIE
ncbi:MAG: hypothetical protein E4H21_10195, partial [Thermodesulfobacteriales bacterium]